MMLDDLRNEIDKIDEEMKALFERRMEIAEKVAESKAKTGDKVLKPEREEAVIRRLTAGMGDSFRTLYISFIKKTMALSRSRQYAKMRELRGSSRINNETEPPKAQRVCYQGLPGVYSKFASEKMFSNYESYQVETFEDVIREIDEERAYLGILPVNENHSRFTMVFACKHGNGSLAGVLSAFGDYGANLTEINTRHSLKKPGEYIFIVNFEGNLMNENIKALIYQLSKELPFLR